MTNSINIRTKGKTDYSWVFILLFIFGAGILLIYDDSTQDQSSKKQIKAPDIVIDEKEKINRVNQHLKETAINLESDRIRRAQEAQSELKKLEEGTSEIIEAPEPGLTFESDQSMSQLSEQLNRSQQLSDEQLTPEQIVQNRLLEIQMQKNADQAYREEYARQFIENARAGGWDIKLGPNFEVLSVRKIRPRKPSLFETPAQ